MIHVLCHWLKKIVYIIAIIALINMGLMPFDINLFTTDFMQFTTPWLIAPFHYAAGIAGILLLIKFVACLSGKSSCMCGGNEGRDACGSSHKMN
jgi:uncharacterized membrane protein YuzA (DUF378 family)